MHDLPQWSALLHVNHFSIYFNIQVEHCVVSHNNYVIYAPVASAPNNLMGVREGLTNIRVSWSPPTPLGNTTGYRISYSNGSSSHSVDVSGGSTDKYLLYDWSSEWRELHHIHYGHISTPP